ncbi:uncharacterized protein LAESUDRAFT_754969 [Laetiporus sulphureus 93-53]|uniref:Uncharacterized protein n=1 Tax=Laetiporus sulphureus 93-53 TaxID=1314785 RepID=A0A165H6D4_9APHY|nr:uncharacterized protein LAESUDRAFT_754969 [Laetiporus sulphureus 93-53]KZT11304.1 hypothetical protein LAESUDRAFT_754969 [Laetiporus sulphureus 93-53]
MSSGNTAQDPAWKAKEQGEEARYAHQKAGRRFTYTTANRYSVQSDCNQEQEQLAALKAQAQTSSDSAREDKPYEAGYGGQEDLEDRYATTSGEH